MPIDPNTIRFTRRHLWLRPHGNGWRIGLSRPLVETLGLVEFVDLPRVGERLTRGRPFGLVEGARSVEDVSSPVDGVVTAVNVGLVEAPEIVNADPEDDGWLICVLSEPLQGEFLTREAYLVAWRSGTAMRAED